MSAGSEIVLEARNITKRFPGVVANENVSLKLHRGEVLALLGENVAGSDDLRQVDAVWRVGRVAAVWFR